MVVTLDGFYEGPNGEFDWPNVDQEFNEFGIEQLHDTDLLVFGRATYEGMAGYWHRHLRQPQPDGQPDRAGPGRRAAGAGEPDRPRRRALAVPLGQRAAHLPARLTAAV